MIELSVASEDIVLAAVIAKGKEEKRVMCKVKDKRYHHYTLPESIFSQESGDQNGIKI